MRFKINKIDLNRDDDKWLVPVDKILTLTRGFKSNEDIKINVT